LRALAFVLLVAGAACDPSGPRIYTARAYDPSARCLADYAPLGLVQAGDLGASCDPVCLQVGDALYVSTVCPPYPASASSLAADDPTCRAALAALAADASCSASDDASADAPLSIDAGVD